MSNMPERIWAYKDGGRLWEYEYIHDLQVEYIRADLYNALAKERDALKREADAMREKAVANARERNAAEAKVAALADEVGRLREGFNCIAGAVQHGLTENGLHDHRIKATPGTSIEGGWIIGPTANDIRNTLAAIRDIARALLAQAKEQDDA